MVVRQLSIHYSDQNKLFELFSICFLLIRLFYYSFLTQYTNFWFVASIDQYIFPLSYLQKSMIYYLKLNQSFFYLRQVLFFAYLQELASIQFQQYANLIYCNNQQKFMNGQLRNLYTSDLGLSYIIVQLIYNFSQLLYHYIYINLNSILFLNNLDMSYAIEPRRLKKLIDYYSPQNNFQEVKFLKVFGGEENLLRHLETSPFQGIDSTSIEQRITEFGSNQMVHDIQKSKWCELLVTSINQLPVKLFLIFTVMTLFLDLFYTQQHIEFPWVQGIGFGVFFITTFILLIVPEIQMQKDNNLIKQYNEPTGECMVWRDNQKIRILATQLVVGDILELQPGSYVGSDGLLIQGELTVKQKSGQAERQATKMTKKQCIENYRLIASKKIFMAEFQAPNLPSPIVIGGSTVLKGQGRMIVLCVGKYSQKGYKSMLIHESSQRKNSKTYQKVKSLIFECSKYMVLILIIQIILYCIKHALIIVLTSSLQITNWVKITKDLCHCITLVLCGIPYFLNIGLFIGLLKIKLSIWKEHQIYFKYARDCDKIGNISTIIYQQYNPRRFFYFRRWWNQDFQSYDQPDIQNLQYKETFIKSLEAQEFDPMEFGIQLSSFYVGINDRQKQFMKQAIKTYLQTWHKVKDEIDAIEEGGGDLSSLQSQNEEISMMIAKHFRGNAETLLKICTHIYNKNTGDIQFLTESKKHEIQKIIWKINLNRGMTLITGYMEINVNHPRYRQGNSRIVLISLLDFQINEDLEEFQAFLRIKKKGFNFLLIGDNDQNQIITKSKEIGMISGSKPAINLKGYDFLNITGGILCKHCKKSICNCSNKKDFACVLKNQDQFTSIQRHIYTLSEANLLERLSLVIGYKNSSSQGACIFGSKIEDIPSMKASQLSLCVKQAHPNKYAQLASQIILKSGKLSELYNLIAWSSFTQIFYKKYTILYLTACIVAFAINFIGFLFFDTQAIKLIQCLWVFIIICPLLGITFTFGNREQLTVQDRQNNNNLNNPSQLDDNIKFAKPILKQNQLLDKTNSRHLISQTIFQIFLLLFVYLFGKNIIPQSEDAVDEIIASDWAAKYSNQTRNTVCWGVRTNIFELGADAYETTFDKYSIYSRHFTFLFNLFVLLQFMNYLLCRICHKNTLNLFEGINIPTICLVIVIMTAHCFVVQFGGGFFGLYPYGLTLIQWSICFGLSMTSCVFGILIKQIPTNDEKQGARRFRIWPNRAYNLAVMSIAPRQDLIDFEIDQDFEFEEGIKQNHND